MLFPSYMSSFITVFHVLFTLVLFVFVLALSAVADFLLLDSDSKR